MSLPGSPLTTRRRFLASSALASSLLILPRGLRGQGSRSPNDRLRIALIGVGGRGQAALQGLQDEQIVAFCDVDDVVGREKVAADEQLGPVLARFGDAKWFKDFRVMFEQMGDQIDAVVVSTPDHTHFAAAMAAVRAGKHVYVEKPLCHAITEVRALQAAAKQAGVVTQMGNQGRAAEGIRLAREWIQAGVIGDVHTVHTWTDRPRKPWFYDAAFDPDAEPEETVPPHLDWDLWLGPAPLRPYRQAFVPAYWRSFVEFGCGSLGDMGCHQMDAPFYALELGAPTSIEAATTKLFPKTFPNSSTITYKFPANGWRGPVELKWFDGGLFPPRPVAGFEFQPDGGSLYYGTKGIMHVTGWSGSARLLPDTFMAEMRSSLPPKTLPRVKGGPYAEWTEAIRQGGVCGSNFDYSGPLSEMVLLGVAAIRAQTTLQWDPVNLRFPNHPEADVYLGPGYEYRRGWGV